jgi:phosphoserine phosphatase
MLYQPHALILVATNMASYREALLQLGRVAQSRGAAPPAVLAPWEAAEWAFDKVDDELRAEALAATAGLPVDIAILPATGRRKKLLVADMDSTIITVECLDELADFAGIKDKISAITERAMRGELDFEAALTARVAMLKGLGLDALARAYDERVKLTPGARVLVRTMAAHGARCVLVSGGFTYFTARVAKAAGFAADRANTLIDDGRVLTGAVGQPILGRQAKLQALKEEAAALGAAPGDALAIGDGANDLDMIRAAGLGLAFRAKPIVAAEADAEINHANLRAALFFQGYRAAEFVED